MVKIIKTWQTALFVARKGGISVTVELNMNHKDKTYELCTGSEEAVSFKNDSVLQGELKVKALQEAMKFVKQELS